MTVIAPVSMPSVTAAAWALSALGGVALFAARDLDRRITAAVLATVMASASFALFDSTICKYAWWALECWLF